MTRLKNIQMILCISLTMMSFLFGDKTKKGMINWVKTFHFLICKLTT
jgi:hypothetical protein